MDLTIARIMDVQYFHVLIINVISMSWTLSSAEVTDYIEYLKGKAKMKRSTADPRYRSEQFQLLSNTLSAKW